MYYKNESQYFSNSKHIRLTVNTLHFFSIKKGEGIKGDIKHGVNEGLWPIIHEHNNDSILPSSWTVDNIKIQRSEKIWDTIFFGKQMDYDDESEVCTDDVK